MAARAKAETHWRWTIGIGLVGLAAAIALLVAHRRGRADLVPLSSQERQPLVAVANPGGGRVLVHPQLGFWFRHPGGEYRESEEAVARLREEYQKDDSSQFYAYTDSGTGGLLLVSLSKRARVSRADLQRMVGNVQVSFLQKTANQIGDYVEIQVVEDQLSWERGEARYHAVLAGKDHLRIGAWSGDWGGSGAFVVMLVGITAGTDSLAEVLGSFRRDGRPAL